MGTGFVLLAFSFLPRWWNGGCVLADRHGATSSSKFGGIDEHYHSPWEMGGNKSLNHHWWEPFLHWGGVGRGTDSLRQLMTDSYPQAFEGHVGTMLLDSVFEMMKQSQHHNSHFPASPMPHLNGGINSDSYTRKRGNWSAVSNHAYLHPSEIRGVGGRMQVPSDALLMTPLGGPFNHTLMLGIQGGAFIVKNTPHPRMIIGMLTMNTSRKRTWSWAR